MGFDSPTALGHSSGPAITDRLDRMVSLTETTGETKPRQGCLGGLGVSQGVSVTISRWRDHLGTVDAGRSRLSGTQSAQALRGGDSS